MADLCDLQPIHCAAVPFFRGGNVVVRCSTGLLLGARFGNSTGCGDGSSGLSDGVDRDRKRALLNW